MNTTLQLLGIPPSKKNEHIIIQNKRTGRRMIIPNNDYRKWEAAAALSLLSQRNAFSLQEFSVPVAVDCLLFVGNRVKWDLSNKVESIMDALVRGRVLSDDNRFCVPDLRIRWRECQKGDDRAVITLTQVEAT